MLLMRPKVSQHMDENAITHGDTWVVQSVKCPTLAQIMISWFRCSSSELGCGPTAQSLEPASDSLSLPLPCSLSLSQK